MTYYKPNTFFTQSQVLQYALDMIANNKLTDIKVEMINDLNAGFVGRLVSNYSLWADVTHTVQLNYKAMARHAMHYNINAHQFALSVIAHELGHYMDYENYNGLDYADIVQDTTCPIEKQKAVILLEKNAGKYARKYFVTDDFREVFNTDNQRNIDFQIKKLNNIIESTKVIA